MFVLLLLSFFFAFHVRGFLTEKTVVLVDAILLVSQRVNKYKNYIHDSGHMVGCGGEKWDSPPSLGSQAELIC